jgi:transposase
MNPIENLYAKLKSDLRKGAARTVDALSRIISRSLKAIAPAECAGYFRHARYRT